MARRYSYVKTTIPLDDVHQQRLKERLKEEGLKGVLADPLCPVSEQAICRAAAGQPIMSVTRVALSAWLDGRLVTPEPASTAPSEQDDATRAA
jgi:hypothetical protein